MGVRITPNLRELVELTKIPILDKLAKVEKPEVDFLDVIKDQEGVLSFLDKNRVELDPYRSWSSPKRQTAKAGRLIKRLLPELSDNEVRNFVEALQAVTIAQRPTIVEVDGSEIYKYYIWPKAECNGYRGSKGLNYWDWGSGGLLTSCYQGCASPEYFELFENNPEYFGLIACLVDGKLDTRGLVVNALVDNKETRIAGSFTFQTAKNRIATENYAVERGYTLYPGSDLMYSGRLKFPGGLKPGKQLHHWYLSFDSNTNTLQNKSYSESMSVPYQLPYSEWK